MSPMCGEGFDLAYHFLNIHIYRYSHPTGTFREPLKAIKAGTLVKKGGSKPIPNI